MDGLRRLSGALALAWAPALCAAAPSTFGTVIGNGLLCHHQLDNIYFHAYLTQAFGPSYKREGGAFWFKADGMLWGTPITDVLVSDDTSDVVFLAAVADATPDKLDESIRAAAGTRFRLESNAPFALRQSSPGSKIVYFNAKSKVYCAKFKPLPPGL